VNDTIVVFDRIREELGHNPGRTLKDVIHFAINRTLSRTVLTSSTVFLCAVALWAFGAGDVRLYGEVFIYGVLTGTFSSIFIASPIFYWWHKGDRKGVDAAELPRTYSWEAGSDTK
jgi:SecD/SecF fusion protein